MNLTLPFRMHFSNFLYPSKQKKQKQQKEIQENDPITTQTTITTMALSEAYLYTNGIS